MAGENVNSPLLNTLVPSASLSASSASQQQPMPAASPSSLSLGANSVPPASVNSAQMPAGSGVGGVAGQGHQQYAGPQQNSHLPLGNSPGPSSNLQPMNLQSLQLQPNSAGQLHAVSLTQGQAFGQNQQSLARNPPSNQMNYQQNQQQKQAGGTRTQHGQYAQNQLNSGNMQAQDLSQQAASVAMVQSPPGSQSITRTSSGQRILQLPQGTSIANVRAAALGSQFGPGSLTTVSSVGGTAAIQQQQLLMAQRAAQGQGAITPQQRPIQSPQATQHSQQHSSMQSGQTGTQSLHQQVTPSGIMGSSSSLRPLYGAQYSQHIQQRQQVGNHARPGMGGQATGHPSMLPVQGSQQLSGLQTQLSSQPIQGRQKQGQVQASQFPASATGGPQIQIGMMGSISAMGPQLVRPSAPHTQQQWVQQTQTRTPQQQQQPPQQHQQPLQQQQAQQLPQQPQSLTSPQKLQAQQLQRVPSVGSIGSGLQSSSQSPAGSGTLPNQQQHTWVQKQMHQQSTASTQYQVLQQQSAQQQKQAQTQHSQQLQSQQLQMSQQTQQPMQQQGRVQPSAVQRPLTPTGVQPGTPSSNTPTNLGGAMSQPAEPGNRILGKRSIQELVAQVDPNERLDPEVEDILLEIADDFIESVTTFSCKLAKHRKSNVLEAKDVLLHLNRNWDINIPGFGGEEYHAYKRLSVSEIHKQRLASVKKSIATQPTGQDLVAGKASGGQSANANTGSQAPMIV